MTPELALNGGREGSRMIDRHLKPPACNTGAHPRQNAQNGTSASLDWYRITGPAETDSDAFEVLSDFYPELEDTGHGRGFYGSLRECGETSAQLLLENHNRGGWQIELPGRACQWIGFKGMLVLDKELNRLPGCNVRRLDCAVDIQNPWLDMSDWIDRMEESCRACSISPRLESRNVDLLTGGAVSGRTLYIGSPQSRQFVRFYDKGLEQGGIAGTWLRWEAQFNADSAPFAMQRIRDDPTVDTIRRLAVGVLQDVEGPGRGVWQSFSDRPVAVPTRKWTSTAQSHLDHFRRSIAPTWVEAAHQAGVHPIELFAVLDPCSGVLTPKNTRRSAIAKGLAMMYKSCARGEHAEEKEACDEQPIPGPELPPSSSPEAC